MIKKFYMALIVMSSLFLTPAAFANAPIYTSFFSNAAVGGYDPVAYFSEGKPVKGKDQFTLKHQGADWYFASQANLDSFKQQPEKYAPQYGGYCAWAAGMGNVAKGDPNHWSIYDGKLYLNYNGDIQSKWSADKDNLIKQANINWPDLLN